MFVASGRQGLNMMALMSGAPNRAAETRVVRHLREFIMFGLPPVALAHLALDPRYVDISLVIL